MGCEAPQASHCAAVRRRPRPGAAGGGGRWPSGPPFSYGASPAPSFPC